MKFSTNSFTVLAISCSILLLIGLELVWLKVEYENEMSRFHRETHMLLRNTIFELNDSLLQKNLTQFDSTFFASKAGDSGILNQHQTIRVQVDSASKPHIFISSQASPHHNFMLRFRFDSLQHEVIQERFHIALDKAGLKVPFQVILLNEATLNKSSKFLPNEIIHTPSGVFKLEFSNIDWLIMRKISPQIIFSLILTLLVIGSFIVLYRNLKLQQRLVSIKDGLIANISHELKTPITTVGVALEGMKNFKGQHDQKTFDDYLNIAEGELRRLAMLTDKVLKTSIDENGLTHFNNEAIDLKALINQVIKSLQLIIEKKNLKIDYTESGMDFNIWGDPDHLGNAVFNLLDNAIKFSPDGSSILVTLTENKTKVSCSFKDNGIGIPKEFHSRVFEKFFRVPSGDIHQTKGYGLGLSYVKSIVHKHHGQIELTSEPGNGTCFTIHLPKSHDKK